MTLYDALNLSPALLVGGGLMALAFACLFMAFASYGDEGVLPRAIHYTSLAGFLMILVFFILCGSLLTDARLTALATDLGLDAQIMSWGFLHLCSGLMWISGGNFMLDYDEEGEPRDGYWFIGLGVVLVVLGLPLLLGFA